MVDWPHKTQSKYNTRDRVVYEYLMACMIIGKGSMFLCEYWYLETKLFLLKIFV